MTRKRDLPEDWKELVAETIRKECPNGLFDEISQETLLALLRHKDVEDAAEILWQREKDAPEADRYFRLDFPWLFYKLLGQVYWVERPNRTRKEFLDIANALDTLLVDNAPETAEEVEVIEKFKFQYLDYAKSATKTKPLQMDQRKALCYLRIWLIERYGNQIPVNKVIGLLMRAAYGGKWNANMVAVRANEWKKSVKLVDFYFDDNGNPVEEDSDMESILKRIRKKKLKLLRYPQEKT